MATSTESNISSDSTFCQLPVPGFGGNADEDVRTFVQRLQGAAFARGLRSHDDWIADYASILLSGEALMWWSSLGVEVQTSWYRLREALLAQFPVARMTAPAPEPAAAAPPPQVGIMNGSSQTGGADHTIPPLTAVTAQSIAVTVWASSEHHGPHGIRIYKPENGNIREICNKHSRGQPFDWEVGCDLEGPVGISDTAPLAAANSFGSGLQECISLYYVSQDNHLRVFQFDLGGQWRRGSLDVQLSGICTGLHAAWHAEPNGSLILTSVWTICWIVSGTVHIKQERYDPRNNCTSYLDYSSVNWSKVPLTLVIQKTKTPEAVLFTTDNTELRGQYQRYFRPVNIFPANVAHDHCVAGIDCDPRPEMRFFLTEQNTVNQYTFDLVTKRSSGPLSLVPRGQVSPGSPITAIAWHTQLPTIFVFFLYLDRKIGFYRYDYAVPPGQRQSIHSVQL
ncbi:hypothetical protein FRB95_003903 [Tulasnella sp. JGI-2019a]|nr:hypothetical protein FRB95_003903 [Tulasnella sp. JGI-2019a]